MAVTTGKMSIIVVTLGVISFVLGVVAENKKPASGTPIQRNDVVICKYPTDPTVLLGYMSFGFLLASSVMGCFSSFYPYKGVSLSSGALFRHAPFSVFFGLALGTTGLAAALILWPTITEQHYLTHNIVPGSAVPNCPTAKTGLIGGGAFLSLNSSLFWLASLMLLSNNIDDHLDQLVPKS